MPDCAISADIIAGFCSETEEDHQETMEVIAFSRYTHAFMFAYSERPGTLAAKKYPDDVEEAVKKRRLQEIIKLQNQISLEKNQEDIDQVYEVLIEGNSKRSADDWCGRNDHNKMVVFPKLGDHQPGDYVKVRILSASSATLKGEMVVSELVD